MNAQFNLRQALESVTESIDLYRLLVQRLPRVFGRLLLATYWTQVDVLDGLGRTDEASDLRRWLDGRPEAG